MRLVRVMACIIAAAILTIAIGLVVWVGDSRDGELMIRTGLLVMGLMIVAMSMVVALRRGKARRLMYGGIGLLGVTGIGSLIGLWLPRGLSELPATVLAVTTGWAVLIGYVGVALSLPLRRQPGRALRWITLLIAVSLALTLPVAAVLATASGRSMDELVSMRLLAANAVLAVGSLLAMAVAARFERAAHTIGAPDAGRFEITCPRCQLRQTLALGGDVCAGCRLYLRIQLP